MIPGIDPKVDFVFKRIFGLERNRRTLMHLLNAILLPRLSAPVTDLDLLNPFNEKETSSDKLSIADLKARDQLGRQFHVEMQLWVNWVFPDRTLYYWSRLHALQLREPEQFEELRHTVTICFLDAELYRRDPQYHWCFQLRDQRQSAVVFSPHIEMHLLELPKFRLPVEGLRTPLERWLYFLRHGAQLDSEALPPNLEVPEIRQALEELIMVTQDERDRIRYEDRLKAELDARSFHKDAKETGRREGLQEGVIEGHKEGVIEGRKEMLAEQIRWCLQLLQQPPTPREELLPLPEAELRRVKELLEQQLAARLSPPQA